MRLHLSVFPIVNMVINIIDIYLGRPRNIMSFFGVWLPPNHYKIAHTIYMIVVMISQYSFLLFELIYLSEVIDDLDVASEASYLLFTQASLCYKTTKFLLNKSNLIELLALMEQYNFRPNNSTHEKLLQKFSLKINRLCAFFLTSALTTCTLWAMIPLFDNVGGRIFPFRIWMPVSTEKSPHYEIGYIYQVIAIYISAFLFIAVDSVSLSMIMFGCAQLDILMDKVNKLQNISSVVKTDYRRSMLKENHTLLKECIKHYQKIVSFIQKVENTYHANIFFQLGGSAAIICITGLRISIVEPGSVQFLSMVNYMVTMLSQLFLYCWCGHELTIRSERLRIVLYQCPWYEEDNKFRRTLCFTMERMKRPIIFKAGHYIPLSRQTFIYILRTSYSYFAVLNQANDK